MKMVRITSVLGFCALVALAVLGSVPASAMSPSLDWKFGVLLDDKKIGYHNFTVTENDGRQVLETEAKFDVKFLFITAFTYRHENVEAWQGDCLASIDARTDNNGKELAVSGRRTDDGFEVSGASGTAELPSCVQTFAYWRPDILEADRLLNSQTGEYEDVTVAYDGEDEVQVGELTIPATRYRLSAKAGDITLWYASDDSRWLALEAPAKGGRTIRYQPVAVPEAVAAEQMMARSE